MRRIIKYVFMVGILFLCGILSALLVMDFAYRGKEVVVPEIAGRDIVFALEMLSERNLNLKVIGWEYSNSIPKNFIISQKPLPSQSIKKDGDVKVIISKGTKEVVVPMLVGEKKRRAEITLKRNDFKIGEITRVYSSKFQKDTIIAQSPLPQKKIKRGARINLLISRGEKKDAYLMPNLVRRNLGEAMEILGKMKLGLGEIKKEVQEDIKPGLVLEHEPKYGHKIAEAEKVNLIISKAPGPDKSQEGTYQLLYYRTPKEMGVVNVRILLENNREVKEIYNHKERGGKDIKLLIKVDENTRAKIYLNDALVEERVF